MVRAIPVHDGQSVKAGQVLVELDPTTNAAERDRLASALMVARLEIARLGATLSDAADPAAPFLAPPGATPAQVTLARQLMATQAAEHAAKLAGLDRQQAQQDANRAAVAATVDKLSALLPILRQRVEMRKTLYDRQLDSKLTYLTEQQQMVEGERELVVQKDRLTEAEAALATIAEQRRQANAEFRRSLLGELAQAQEKADNLAQELVKAELRTRLQTLTTPVDGVVQQLAIHTVGGVVTPAEALMAVVPAESPLEIEAMVSNQDVGFVHAGQKAAIKIETFDFTHYGLLHGEVLGVSRGAVNSQSPLQAPAAAPAPSTATMQPRSMGSGYTARISLDRVAIRVRRQAGRSPPRHGGDGRDRHRHQAGDRLSALAALALRAGKSAGAVMTSALIQRCGDGAIRRSRAALGFGPQPACQSLPMTGLISAANMGPNRFHHNRTVSWQISIPRSKSRSSTCRSESG